MQMCTPGQLPMKETFRIRPMPSCFSMKAHAYNTVYLHACHYLGSKWKVWPAHNHMENANYGNVRIHRQSTTDNWLFDTWGTRWFECSKQNTFVTAQPQMQSLMRLQRVQFYAWLPQRSAEHKKTNMISHFTLHISSFIVWRELDFYSTSTKGWFHFRKAAHEYYNQHEPL